MFHYFLKFGFSHFFRHDGHVVYCNFDLLSHLCLQKLQMINIFSIEKPFNCLNFFMLSMQKVVEVFKYFVFLNKRMFIIE